MATAFIQLPQVQGEQAQAMGIDPHQRSVHKGIGEPFGVLRRHAAAFDRLGTDLASSVRIQINHGVHSIEWV